MENVTHCSSVMSQLLFKKKKKKKKKKIHPHFSYIHFLLSIKINEKIN